MTSQKGFTLVEGLLIVLVLSVLGFSGYFVWNQQQGDKTYSDIDSNATQESTTDSPFTNQKDQNAVEYLAIEEWGVKIPLVDETKDAYYTTENGYVYLQVDIEGDSTKSCSNQAALTKADESWLNSDENNPPITISELKDFGSYVDGVYYFMTGSQSTCTEDLLIQEKAASIRTSWLSANKSIVAID